MKKRVKKDKKELNSLLGIFTRYIIALVLGLNLWIFDSVFLPLTFYPIIFILKLFFDISYLIPYIIIDKYAINLVSACIAGSAYYLLAVLVLITRGIDIKKRLKMILFAFSTFFIVNIIRIIVLSVLFINEFNLFDLAHKVTWYGLSAIFVFFVWLLTIKIFKIKTIPFYSDFLYIKGIRK